MQTLHYLQMQILRELLYKPNSRFSQLNISGLTSDHFTYHIQTLIDKGLVVNESGRYKLSVKGKEFANTMDTDRLQIEKQPKIGVMIIARNNGKYLVQQRLKEPYYGVYGFVTGKIRFGETINQTAMREFKEETGLSAKFELRYILHEHVYNKDGDLLEDKIFFVIRASSIKGKLISTKEGKNSWISEQDYLKIEQKYYDEVDILNSFKNPEKPFVEKTYIIEQF